MGELIVISSGKGGVGKTTTCVNLSTALAKQNKNVILVDGNLTTPNVGLHLGLTRFPASLNNVLKGEADLNDAVYLHPLGFKLLPGSLSIRNFSEVNSRKLKKTFEDLKDMADFVIVDSAAGLGNESLSVLKNADNIILVTNPELPAITDAFKIATVAKEIGIPIKGVVLNKVRKENYDLGEKAIEALLEVPITTSIKDDKNMRESIYVKRPIVHIKPNSDSSRAYEDLARRMHDDEYRRRVKKYQQQSQNALLTKILEALRFRQY